MAVQSKNAKTAGRTQLNLRTRRMNKGISLQQIAETTKISPRFLHAIEDEAFDQLPGGIFDKSYLRQYASAVELDEANLLAFYERETIASRSKQETEPAGRGLWRWFRFSAAAGR
jgi:cytoskeletal protein RodZ